MAAPSDKGAALLDSSKSLDELFRLFKDVVPYRSQFDMVIKGLYLKYFGALIESVTDAVENDYLLKMYLASFLYQVRENRMLLLDGLLPPDQLACMGLVTMQHLADLPCECFCESCRGIMTLPCQLIPCGCVVCSTCLQAKLIEPGLLRCPRCIHNNVSLAVVDYYRLQTLKSVVYHCPMAGTTPNSSGDPSTDACSFRGKICEVYEHIVSGACPATNYSPLRELLQLRRQESAYYADMLTKMRGLLTTALIYTRHSALSANPLTSASLDRCPTADDVYNLLDEKDRAIEALEQSLNAVTTQLNSLLAEEAKNTASVDKATGHSDRLVSLNEEIIGLRLALNNKEFLLAEASLKIDRLTGTISDLLRESRSDKETTAALHAELQCAVERAESLQTSVAELTTAHNSRAQLVEDGRNAVAEAVGDDEPASPDASGRISELTLLVDKLSREVVDKHSVIQMQGEQISSLSASLSTVTESVANTVTSMVSSSLYDQAGVSFESLYREKKLLVTAQQDTIRHLKDEVSHLKTELLGRSRELIKNYLRERDLSSLLEEQSIQHEAQVSALHSKIASLQETVNTKVRLLLDSEQEADRVAQQHKEEVMSLRKKFHDSEIRCTQLRAANTEQLGRLAAIPRLEREVADARSEASETMHQCVELTEEAAHSRERADKLAAKARDHELEISRLRLRSVCDEANSIDIVKFRVLSADHDKAREENKHLVEQIRQLQARICTDQHYTTILRSKIREYEGILQKGSDV